MKILQRAAKRAPRWFRILKRILYFLAGTSLFTGTLTRFGITPTDQTLIVGWMLTGGEILNIILIEGEKDENATFELPAAPKDESLKS